MLFMWKMLESLFDKIHIQWVKLTKKKDFAHKISSLKKNIRKKGSENLVEFPLNGNQIVGNEHSFKIPWSNLNIEEIGA